MRRRHFIKIYYLGKVEKDPLVLRGRGTLIQMAYGVPSPMTGLGATGTHTGRYDQLLAVPKISNITLPWMSPTEPSEGRRMVLYGVYAVYCIARLYTVMLCHAV